MRRPRMHIRKRNRAPRTLRLRSEIRNVHSVIGKRRNLLFSFCDGAEFFCFVYNLCPHIQHVCIHCEFLPCIQHIPIFIEFRMRPHIIERSVVETIRGSSNIPISPIEGITGRIDAFLIPFTWRIGVIYLRDVAIPVKCIRPQSLKTYVHTPFILYLIGIKARCSIKIVIINSTLTLLSYGCPSMYSVNPLTFLRSDGFIGNTLSA